jgi:hypothetical protein
MKKFKFKFKGAIYDIYDNYRGDFQSETVAESMAKAKNNLAHQAKIKLGYHSGMKINLKGHYDIVSEN